MRRVLSIAYCVLAECCISRNHGIGGESNNTGIFHNGSAAIDSGTVANQSSKFCITA